MKNFRLFQTERVCKQQCKFDENGKKFPKRIRKKGKLLITSKFSFSLRIFQRLELQRPKNTKLFGKLLTANNQYCLNYNNIFTNEFSKLETKWMEQAGWRQMVHDRFVGVFYLMWSVDSFHPLSPQTKGEEAIHYYCWYFIQVLNQFINNGDIPAKQPMAIPTVLPCKEK